MIINHNISAKNAYRNLTNSNSKIDDSLEKLSSGLRINKAGDDAAGLAISEKMRAQVNGLDMAKKNAQDGISLIQTAEGALNETHSILQRMRELSVQSANDTNTTADREQIQLEVDELVNEINRIGEDTQFNTKNLLSGAFSSNAISFHVGPNSSQKVSINIDSMRASALGISSLSISSQTNAEAAITTVDDAIQTVSTQRSNLGAVQNRLEHTINNLGMSAENLQAAESRIRDVDMAKEMVEYTKNSVISQAGTAMLSQANSSPQKVLQLFD
ncbi:MAG: flagellin [Fusobacteriota bacterium]